MDQVWFDLWRTAAAIGIAKSLYTPIMNVHPLVGNLSGNSEMSRYISGLKIIPSKLKSLYYKGGYPALFKGNLPHVLNNIAFPCFAFAFKELVRSGFYVANPYGKVRTSLFNNLAIGGVAGILATTIYHPIFVAEALMLSERKTRPEAPYSKKVSEALKEVFIRKGLKGFYAGFGVSLITRIFQYSFYFGIYDTFRHIGRGRSVFSNYIVAHIASGISFLAYRPFDLLIQNQLLGSGNILNVKTNLEQAYKRDGIKGLYKPSFPLFTRNLIVPPLVLVLFDEFRKLTLP